jgi:hypothetical protein
VCQVKLGELEAELLEINANNEKLQRSHNELLEYKLVLQKVWLVFLLSKQVLRESFTIIASWY